MFSYLICISMRLTTYTDYALRVLMHVALNDGKRVRVEEIATSFGISRNHLTKVVHQLSTSGYLATVQGRNGGMTLARPTDQINVAEVVRDFESDFTLVECFETEESTCPIDRSCVLKEALAEAVEAFMERLSAITLSDLVRPRKPLIRSLEIQTS